MKDEEILRRAAHGDRNFNGTNLRGLSFKGKDLSGADFSNADIRGVNFTDALLIGANFTRSIAGLPRHWAISLTILSLLVSAISGFASAFVGFFLANLFTPQIIRQFSIFPGVTAIFLLAIFLIFTVRRGLEAAFGSVTLVGVIAVFLAAFWAVGSTSASVTLLVSTLLAIVGTMTVALALAIALATTLFISETPAAIAAGVSVLAAAIVVAPQFQILVITLPIATALVLLGSYVSWRTLKGDKKYTLIRRIAIAIASTGGTSFRHADISGAIFARATLKSTDLRYVLAVQTLWKDARQIDRARLEGTILVSSNVRNLLVTGQGRNSSYIECNLRGANLVGADLSDTDLEGTDISNATLEGACLERANLTKTQALDTNFRQAILTGSCIESWNINSTTSLEGVICDYVYLKSHYQERRPSSGNFAPSEFTKLFQEVLGTVDFIFRNGVEWKAFVAAFQALRVDNDGTELAIQSIENKGDGVVVVRINTPADSNKAKLHSEFSRTYETALKTLEAKYDEELKAKDAQIDIYRQQSEELIEITKLLAQRPLDVNLTSSVMNSSEAVADRTISINVGGDISNIISDSNQTITISTGDVDRAEIEIQTAVKFLEQTGATVSRKGKYSLEVSSVPGSLSSYVPFSVVFAIEQPKAQDVVDLVEQSLDLTGSRQKGAGIVIYIQPPEDTLFWMKMTEVRLRDHFILIPIPFAAVDRAFVDDAASLLQGAASKALLAEYVDRYLPGADFFNDRNAIGDTLTFFGRDEILHRLQEELRRNQGIGLFGLRKSGKTSLLIQLGFSMQKHPVIHIDLQPYGGRLHYGAELFNQIIQQLLKLANEYSSSTSLSLEIFNRDQPAAELTTNFSRQFCDLVKVLIEAGYEMPILLFLDEIERILPSETDSAERVEEFNALFGVLRALGQEQRKISLLVADVHPDCNRINQWKQVNVPTNPVFNFFKEFFLPPFSQEETVKMLVDIGKIMDLSFDEKTLLAIHHESGGHPFLSRQLASLIHNKVATEGNKEIEWSIAQRYIKKPFIYSGILKDYFGQNIWSDLQKRNFDSAIAVLKLLACNENLEDKITDQSLFDYFKGSFTESQCIDALLWLEKVGLVDREELGESNFYKVQISLLSVWIRMQMNEDEISRWQIQ